MNITDKIKALLLKWKEILLSLQNRFLPEETEEEFLEWGEDELSDEVHHEEKISSAIGEPDLAYLHDQVVLVTGGGGSIGSELCRQIARYQPRRLILFDIYENGVYEVMQELSMTDPELEVVVLIGSVQDTGRVNQIFRTYRPQLVFHAAAHKHVPLMEGSPCEAIKNNVLGTLNAAVAAKNNGCRRFVLISTDKAVNPTSIMGASKRLCERIIQAMDVAVKLDLSGENGDPEALSSPESEENESGVTEFVAVRFGNVIDSNGSVLPLFRKQIAMGGPVTVTHPEATRYFMTISEAVALVLQAGSDGKGGEIFVLDMGEPRRIDDLARDMIARSGQEIEIRYTGLRPGEKLLEENLLEQAGLRSTDRERIYVCPSEAIDAEEFFRDLYELKELARINSPAICSAVAGMVPEYHPVQEESNEILPEITELIVSE